MTKCSFALYIKIELGVMHNLQAGTNGVRGSRGVYVLELVAAVTVSVTDIVSTLLITKFYQRDARALYRAVFNIKDVQELAAE